LTVVMVNIKLGKGDGAKKKKKKGKVNRKENGGRKSD